jgi:hypothetical protein
MESHYFDSDLYYFLLRYSRHPMFSSLSILPPTSCFNEAR